MATRKIFNVKTIKDKNYKTLNIGSYNELFGRPESKFIAMNYGESGGGKSVFTLQFAEFFANNFGKVLYNSHEEGVNQTLRDRIVEFNIDAPKLYFGNKLSFDEMVDKIQRNYYRLVIIDSVQYMNFTYAQLKELTAKFSRRQLSIILVSFGTAKGSPTKATDLLHACDIKAYFKNGRVNITSRYLSKPVNKVLFNEQNSGQQLSLFGNEK